MEEMKYSPLSNTSTTTTTADGNREQGTSSMLSRVKKDCFAFGVSLQEGFRYVKATLVGLAKKLKARDEQEAAIADLQAQKMQVKAADEAEDTKKKKIQIHVIEIHNNTFMFM
ncbi:hypothetical protein ES319_D05G229900v1 [Gossypium barbadense]|uniref:Uncharacterized protein n=1 Tax=Gossypium barbadense TaxID=3634 RepID=A0A5J5RFW6_GOSBA|nr:hypothetical protein ES319_D05G229900v1 [Gossypium barbadense]